MSEGVPGTPPPPDPSPPTESREIIHFQKYDAVLNFEDNNVDTVRSLAQQVKDGIPADWIQMGRARGVERRTNIYVDSVKNPQYVAKIRYYGSKHSLEDKRKYLEQVREEDRIFRLGWRGPNYDKPAVYASMSLLNEMDLSSRLKALLATSQVNAIAQKAGFSSIEMVPPPRWFNR